MNLNKYISKESGERIDALLALNFPDLSRNAVQNLLENNQVLLNGVPVKKNYKVKVNDEFDILIPDPEPTDILPENIELDIPYEDNDIIVINKPRGLVVHPAPGHPSGTLVNALLYHCGDSLSGIGGEKRPGIVHRIDKDTSGLLIVAKNDDAHRFLSSQLSDHTLCRVYETVVRGKLKADYGIIDKPIGRNPNDRKKMCVTEKNSKNAITHYSVIQRYNSYTHISCKLETGRTHQIRVHMASVGHPILGDYTYGAPSPDKGLEGQCLHARTLEFIHPKTREKMIITTELPEYFINVIRRLN